MSRHPGRIRENLVTEFKSGRRNVEKEEIIGMAGYADLEKHIMRMMREESPSRSDGA